MKLIEKIDRYTPTTELARFLDARETIITIISKVGCETIPTKIKPI